MNTPLGVLGREHQARRDAHSKVFEARYGTGPGSGTRKAQAADFIKKRTEGAQSARALVTNSGR